MAAYKTGDVFTMKLADGRTTSGRIMLDVHRQCVQPKRVRPDSTLGFFNHSLLVDLYRSSGDLGERLIPGVFTDAKALTSGAWTIIGHEPVDPTTVEFPETLFTEGPHPRFIRGEVKLPVNLSYEEVMELNVFSTSEPSRVLAAIALYYLSHRESGGDPPAPSGGTLAASDLRFSLHRQRVEAALGDADREPYFAYSLRHGFDLRRFYE